MKSLIILLGCGAAFLAFAQQIYALELVGQSHPDTRLSTEPFSLDTSNFELSLNDPEYHIGIVEPDPTIDYKMLNAEIDPDINYTLGIIDPTRVSELDALDVYIDDDLFVEGEHNDGVRED